MPKYSIQVKRRVITLYESLPVEIEADSIDEARHAAQVMAENDVYEDCDYSPILKALREEQAMREQANRMHYYVTNVKPKELSKLR